LSLDVQAHEVSGNHIFIGVESRDPGRGFLASLAAMSPMGHDATGMTPPGLRIRWRLVWVCVQGGKFMTIRAALVGCALAFATLAAGTAANAGDPYGGFGPSETGAQEAGSDPDKGVSTPDDDQTLPWLQPQNPNPAQNDGGGWDQQRAAGGEYDMDDEGGH
jgi:hypothetical protein